MAYTARQLIARSYYLSGIVSRDFQTVEGSQETDGLVLLNGLLTFTSATSELIPFFSRYEFNGVINQESYLIPNLVYAETITFNLQTVRFPIWKRGRKNYFGDARVDGISALPFECTLEREIGGSRLYIYYLPSDNYPIKISGKFSYSPVTLDTDLSLIMPAFYLRYLWLALGNEICFDQNMDFSSKAEKELNKIEKILMDVSPPDLTVSKISTLGKGYGINWPVANLSQGYFP